MNFTKLVPSIFYKDLADAKKLVAHCLQCTITREDLTISQPYCVLEKEGIGLMAFQDEKLAKDQHPEPRLVTNSIDEVSTRISGFFPELLHPKLDKVTLRHWGAKEFAFMDMQLGIRFQQW
ncbi:hypothetical protein JYB64_03175 [Algoriphagus aestuarii]|nr:hypothetical protein [Algoriphagus aestuarii]